MSIIILIIAMVETIIITTIKIIMIQKGIAVILAIMIRIKVLVTTLIKVMIEVMLYSFKLF